MTSEWNRWLAATKMHEDGHRKIVLSTAEEIIEQLGSIGPQPICDDVNKVANDLGNDLLKQMNAQHAKYDSDTKHGRSTGAYLGEDLP